MGCDGLQLCWGMKAMIEALKVLGAAASRAVVLAIVVAVVSQVPGAAVAQTAPAWNATTSKAPGGDGLTLDEKQTAAVKDVSKYFNDLKQMKGVFHQTNADGKHLRGKFFIKQPGRFRFDYGSGSKLIIVSDGKMLSIQDHDLKTDNSWELDRTPFRLLLRKDVDLLRDAAVLEAQDADDLIIVTLQDKNPDTIGKIKLFLVRKPALELKEWVTTDPQGIDTRIEIADLNKTEEIAAEMFKPVSPEILKLQQKQ
jgi:outer membrane lipoprotein-sorting protein